ncbi:hypothetical protein VP01_3979g1 [Puccinia sorghi]|uniref:DNA replication complex GINS protein PSF2 n=1 Tax=Puccinia sorghi TaxID=27349 RepID=A0A0L6USA8_9BASI|nr:hypothetical protein VP01_3979g1 [Puccinia sorghi]
MDVHWVLGVGPPIIGSCFSKKISHHAALIPAFLPRDFNAVLTEDISCHAANPTDEEPQPQPSSLVISAWIGLTCEAGMALPKFQRMAIDPKESVLMMIKTEKMDFIPNRMIAKFRNLDSEMIFEDLRPLKTITLPLWLIIELKLKKLGKVVLPTWLSELELKKLLQYEVNSLQLSELPYFWLEISRLLIEIAADDIDSLEEVKKTLKDLKEVRQNKLRSSLKFTLSSQNQQAQQARDYSFKNVLNHLEIPNLSHFELNEIRPTLTILNSKFQKFDKSNTSNLDNPFNPEASTSISNPRFQSHDYATLETQSQNQFQFYSDHNQLPQPPQAQSSTTTLGQNRPKSISSILNTDHSI